MGPDDLLRLAWEVDRDGRKRVRDSLLTLAVLESGPEDLWAERCRTRLIADRPEHFLSGFATVRQALDDPRVQETREKLRIKHPRVRIERLLFAHRAIRGPYTGRVESILAMAEDLAGPPAEADHVRLDNAQAARGPLARARVGRRAVLRLVDGGESADPDPEPDSDQPDRSGQDPAEFARFYLTVLLAIACLLASIDGDRAAGPSVDL